MVGGKRAGGKMGRMRSKISVSSYRPSRLLNPASGYLKGYTHSLNPYGGCVYACSYCYVRRLPVALFEEQPWGQWVKVKEDAPTLLAKELRQAKAKGQVTLFMSSSTDPYQPLEGKWKLTRRLLEVMTEDPPHFLFIQTRSPLVVRDLDLFIQLKERICVSITIETDREDVRQALTPAAPPLAARRKALKTLRDAGIPSQATVSPILPFTDQFPRNTKLYRLMTTKLSERSDNFVFCFMNTTCYAGGSKELLAVRKIKTSNDIIKLGLANQT
mgnify:CR=1 FL=1